MPKELRLSEQYSVSDSIIDMSRKNFNKQFSTLVNYSTRIYKLSMEFVMDLRVQKTRRNIINAFLQLRAQKPLEKITIKELAALAEINKATFYLHYHDIYELSETLENEVVQSTLRSIEHPESLFRDNKLFTRELADAFIANEQLIKILFEGSRSISFITLFEKELKSLILEVEPDFRDSTEKSMAITYLIYGGYYTYVRFRSCGVKAVFDLIGKFSESIVKFYE